jgi:integrase
MRSACVDKAELAHVLAALTPENRLACEIAMHTGLRIGDVLALRRDQVSRRFSVMEAKTGKRRAVNLTDDLIARLRANSRGLWCFPHRVDPDKHRCRSAVWRDIKRAAKAFRVKENLTPHSTRKAFALAAWNNGYDIGKVQKLLGHDRPETTALYLIAARSELRKKFGKG